MNEPGFTHTPGPWSAERDLPHNRMPRVHGGDGSLICEVGNMGTTQDQWEANARLIAAAPTMYAFIELVAARDDDLGDDAKEVLAQARGHHD